MNTPTANLPALPRGNNSLVFVKKHSEASFAEVDVNLAADIAGRSLYLHSISFLREAGSTADRYLNITTRRSGALRTTSWARSDNVDAVPLLYDGTAEFYEQYTPPLMIGTLDGGPLNRFTLRFEFPESGNDNLLSIALILSVM